MGIPLPTLTVSSHQMHLEITEDYHLLYKCPRRILVLGMPKTGKSSIIDAILSANHMIPEKQTPPAASPPRANNNPNNTSPVSISQSIPPLPTPILEFFNVETNWRIHARNLRDDMIQSQYETDGMIVTEWAEQNAKHTAVQNLKYFPVLKDEFNSYEKRMIKKEMRRKNAKKYGDLKRKLIRTERYDICNFVNFPLEFNC